MTGEGLDDLLQEIMKRVDQRREEMIAAGEEVPVLRQTEREVKSSTRRVPPHLAGPTAELSNDLQAKDYEGSSHEDKS